MVIFSEIYMKAVFITVFLNIFKFSAHNENLENLVTSLMYMLNNKGSTFEPCGTLEAINKKSEEF